MNRSTTRTDHRPLWLAGALLPLALVACGDGKPDRTGTPDRVQSPVSSTPVVPAGGPAVTREVPPPVPRVVTYEDAEAAYTEGRFGEAKELFEVYVESKPGNPWGYYMLGLSAWKSGDLSGAERAFGVALEKDPKHVKSLLNSARVLMDLGRNHEALERVKEARTLDSTSSEAIRLLARAQHRLGDTDAAVKAYREALVGDERDVWAMNNLGMLYIEQKDPQSAVPPLARAVQLRPGSPIFQNNLGMALELTGHLTEAKRAYDDAVKADSTYSKAMANAKRLDDIVVDDSTLSGVDVKELAELFRQWVKMWKDSVPQPQP